MLKRNVRVQFLQNKKSQFLCFHVSLSSSLLRMPALILTSSRVTCWRVFCAFTFQTQERCENHRSKKESCRECFSQNFWSFFRSPKSSEYTRSHYLLMRFILGKYKRHDLTSRKKTWQCWIWKASLLFILNPFKKSWFFCKHMSSLQNFFASSYNIDFIGSSSKNLLHRISSTARELAFHHISTPLHRVLTAFLYSSFLYITRISVTSKKSATLQCFPSHLKNFDHVYVV